MASQIMFVSIVQEKQTVAVFHGETRERVLSVATRSLFMSCQSVGEPILLTSSRPEVGTCVDIWKMPTGEVLTVVTMVSRGFADHI